jgi:RNA polymerase sigma-70 factor (ECF subfamily)
MEAELDLDRQDTARLRRGDLTGLDGLMARHQDRLFRYLRRLLGDETVAEDLFQQTWVRVAERARRYDPSRPFRPWLLTVAHNLALDHLRRRRPEILDEAHGVASAVAPGPAPPGPLDPLAHLAARERRERLEAALAGLGPHDREAIALRFQEDLPLVDIARVLGVPVPTAKARLYRALERLRARVLAEGPREDWA